MSMAAGGTGHVSPAACQVSPIMDRILLQGIQLYGYHGVYDEERRLGQRFLFDVELCVDLAGIETVFVLPNPAHSHVSSSLVRQVAALGGDVSPYVPDAVSRFMASDDFS